MALFNNKNKFGSLTKLFHWSIFLLFVAQYFLVYRREYFPKDAPEKLQYILLHKSLGVVVLTVGLLMIVIRHIGKRPQMPFDMSIVEILLAKLTHFLLYICILLMPITGILMSQYSGRKVSLFSLIDLPTLVEKNEQLGKLCYSIHHWASLFIIGLVSLHILAALYHHWIKKDTVLIRMLPFRKVEIE